MNLVQSEIHKKEKKEKRKRKAIQCDDRREEIRHRKEYAAAKSLQSCPTLCDPTEGSPPGSPVPGILQARTLQWVAISFSNAWKWKVKVKSPSRVRLLAIPWTAAHQAPPSLGFSRQEHWSGAPSPSPREEYEDHLTQTPSVGGWRVEEVLESVSRYIWPVSSGITVSYRTGVMRAGFQPIARRGSIRPLSKQLLYKKILSVLPQKTGSWPCERVA